MSEGPQHTIGRSVQISGRGLFGGADVTLRLLPAPEYHGIVFQRIDLADRVRIPARVEYVLPQPRRTALARLGARVETVEHVLAALAGMQIDNCLVQLDAPECPNGDGSAREFVAAIETAGIVAQSAAAPVLEVSRAIELRDAAAGASWTVSPSTDGTLRIEYHLHAPYAGCERQSLQLAVTPDTFVREIAFARTFVREADVRSLRAAGMGLRTTPRDLLVLDAHGRPIDNELRTPDECVRHKILDCIGDFALAGARLRGALEGSRTGHRHNHELIRRLKDAQPASRRRAA